MSHETVNRALTATSGVLQRAQQAESQVRSLLAQSLEQQERIAQLEAEVLHAEPASGHGMATIVNRREDVDEDLYAQVCQIIACLQQTQSTAL